ncbi:MAG: hypothetical protein EAZ67_13895 [Cytophagales bacterium]|nr:MAG: hypothetical protein EAZ67_13895 [Cytophagales bacterium]
MNNLLKLLILFLFAAAGSCTKKEDVAPAKPSLIGKWTIKTAKNFSATTQTAKANATIDFTETKYTVSQTQPFANYKNKSGLTEYIRMRNSTYKLLPIDEVLPLVEAELKIFGLNNATASKNIAAIIELYKKEGINYVAILQDINVVAINTAGGTETVGISGFGIVDFTANSTILETLNFGQRLSDPTYVPKLPATTDRGQFLMEK